MECGSLCAMTIGCFVFQFNKSAGNCKCGNGQGLKIVEVTDSITDTIFVHIIDFLPAPVSASTPRPTAIASTTPLVLLSTMSSTTTSTPTLTQTDAV